LETNGEAGDTTADRRSVVGPIPLSRCIYRATMTVPLPASQRRLPTTGSPFTPCACRDAPKCRRRVALTKLLDTPLPSDKAGALSIAFDYRSLDNRRGREPADPNFVISPHDEGPVIPIAISATIIPPISPLTESHGGRESRPCR